MLTKTSKFSDKYREQLRQKIRAECKARGLPSVLDLGKNPSARLEITDHVHNKRQGEHVLLLKAGGWAKYSRRFMDSLGFLGIRKDLAILGGVGRQGTWAARVPATLPRVYDALQWLKPARVQRWEEMGLRVWRQGDVWLLETRVQGFGDNLHELPLSHIWDPATRTMSHAGHGVLHIPFNFVAIPQRTLAADGRRRRQGD